LRYKEIEARHPGIPLSWRDDVWLDAEMAKSNEGHMPVIPQTHGSAFIHELTALIELGDSGPAKFVACARLSPQIANAAIISRDGQTWIRLWAEKMQAVLEHRSFREFVAKHGGDESKALSVLANEAFALILASEERDRVLALIAALLRSGELKAASAAATGKN
jgi:hypothetical protein